MFSDKAPRLVPRRLPVEAAYLCRRQRTTSTAQTQTVLKWQAAQPARQESTIKRIACAGGIHYLHREPGHMHDLIPRYARRSLSSLLDRDHRDARRHLAQRTFKIGLSGNGQELVFIGHKNCQRFSGSQFVSRDTVMPAALA